MQKHAGPIIIGAAIVIATCIYIFFSPYHSCMRTKPSMTATSVFAQKCLGR